MVGNNKTPKIKMLPSEGVQNAQAAAALLIPYLVKILKTKRDCKPTRTE